MLKLNLFFATGNQTVFTKLDIVFLQTMVLLAWIGCQKKLT